MSKNKLNFAELYNLIQDDRHVDKSSLFIQLVKVIFLEKSPNKDRRQPITLSHEDDNMCIAQKCVLPLNVIKRYNFKSFATFRQKRGDNCPESNAKLT